MSAAHLGRTAEELFLDYLVAEGLGEKPDFEALKREHPSQADALRELKSEYDDAQRVFVRLGMGAELDASLHSKWLEAREAAAQSHVDYEGLNQWTIPTLERLRELGPHAERYERLGQINRGGMGAIVKVHDKLLRRTLALKEMLAPEDEHQRARLRSRFLEEAEITGRLEHPGIVPVHEMGLSAENGEPFFTMKLVKGRDLDAIFELVVRGDREWTQTRVVREVLLRVCETMSYAHAQGVIHRDLKPSNVMVGAYGEVYVMDWGLARAIARPESAAAAPESSALGRDDAPKPDLTRHGHRVGTPQYMAPEQARGDNASVGPATDIYAVGVMLYRLIAGRTPYVKTGESPGAAAIFERVLAGPPTPLGELAPSTAPELVAICERAMAREIADRYASMSALAAELRAYVEGRVVGAYETGTWAETKKWVTRNKPLAASLSIAFVLLVAGLTASLILKAQSDANALLAVRRAGETAEQARIAKANEEKATQREREALASARRAERVTEFVQNALISSDPNQGGAERFRVVEAMDAAIADLESGALEHDPEIEASLATTIALILDGNGRSEDALRLNERALATVRQLHPGDHADVAAILGKTARSLNALGRSDEALPKYEESLVMYQQLFSGDHPDVANGLNNVAFCLNSLGRSDEALPRFEESLAMYQRLFPGDHPYVASGLNNLAGCLDSLGRSDEALPRYADSLAMRRRLFSGDHPHVASSLSNVGFCLDSLGRSDEALPRFEESLAMYQRLFSGDHPAVANGLNNVAFCWDALGRSDEALPKYEESLAMFQRLFPGDHPDVANGLNNVGLCLDSLGRSDEALPQSEESLAMYQRLFSGDHPDVASGLNSVGSCLDSLGRSGEALPRYEESLAMRRRLFSGDHPDVASSLNNVGFCLNSLGRSADALPRYEESLAMYQRLFSGDHPDVANGLNNVGSCLDSLGRSDEALPKYEESLAMYQRLFSGDHPDVAAGLNNVGLCLNSLGRSDEALPKSEESLAMYQRLFFGDHPRVALGLNNVGFCLDSLGRSDEALPKHEQSLAMRRRLFSGDHPDIADSLHNVATCLNSLGRRAEAIPYIEEANRIATNVWPPGHPRQLQIERTMARLHAASEQ